MSPTYSVWIYVFFCIILMRGLVCAAGVTVTQCPPLFQENGDNTVAALINNSVISAETNCAFGVKDKIEIASIDASGRPTQHCTYNFGTCNIFSAINSSKCGCNNGTGTVYAYTLLFTGTKATQEGGEIQFRSNCQQPIGVYIINDRCLITFRATTVPPTTTVTTTASPTTTDTPKPPCPELTDCCRLCLLLLLLLLLLPIPIPPPWPGYPIYVVLCRIPNQGSSTGSPQPDNWHPHYICGLRTNNVYFSALFVTNDGRTVLIFSRSPTTRRFVWYGTEMTTGTNRNNVSPENVAVNNGNKHTSQKEKNKHTGTDGSPRKSRHPEAPVELTTVRTSSPPQAATIHGDNQASGTPHGDDQASGTPRLRPLPEPSRMTSVERNSTAEYSNMPGRDKHPKLPPIGKSDNHP